MKDMLIGYLISRQEHRQRGYLLCFLLLAGLGGLLPDLPFIFRDQFLDARGPDLPHCLHEQPSGVAISRADGRYDRIAVLEYVAILNLEIENAVDSSALHGFIRQRPLDVGQDDVVPCRGFPEPDVAC